MFRKYSKKILTAVLVVIVTIGLIGPGVLLIFENFQIRDSLPQDERAILPQRHQNLDFNTDFNVDQSTSSPETIN